LVEAVACSSPVASRESLDIPVADAASAIGKGAFERTVS
jgi:hypothetical protein